MKPQSDSPTVAKENFKLIMVVAASLQFAISSMDMRAAFLQAKVLDRNVFIKPLDDIRKPGFVLGLRKLVCCLDDASYKF